MKINMNMVAQLFASQCKNLSGGRCEEFCLVGWRNYIPGSAVSDKYLYLLEANQLADAVASNPLAFFICCTQEADFFEQERSGNVLLLWDVMGIQELGMKVAEGFETYLQWFSDLDEAMFSSNPLEEILNVGARLLVNPIGLFDQYAGLVLAAGDFEGGPQGTLWDDALSTGFSRMEHRNDVDLERAIRGSRPIFQKFTHDSRTRLACALRRDGQFLGMLGSHDYHIPLDMFDHAVFSILKPRLELAISSHKSSRNLMEGTGRILRLLKGESIAPQGIYHILNQWGRRADESYTVFVFDACGKTETERTQRMGGCRYHISNLLPEAKLFFNAPHIIAICYDAETKMNPAFLDKLELVSGRLEMQVGISKPQVGLLNLHVGYAQGCLALEDKRRTYVHSFDETFLPYLADAVRNSPFASALLFPGFDEMAKDNPEYRKELISTLRVYLLTGRNLSSTASKMFVHRHTAEYRIGKIESLLNIRLSDISERTLVQLYLSCLVAEDEMEAGTGEEASYFGGK